MITIPEGFNMAVFVSDLMWVCLPMITVAVLISAYNLIKSVIKRI
jgi:hypothetical protein